MFGVTSSGLEMALRSMGLGSVLDAAQQLAESGAVQKIIQFADGLEETNARMARIEQALGIERPAAVIEGTATHMDGGGALATVEPGSGSADRNVA